MKSFKKKVSKILLSLTMAFTMALTIMPTNVFAAGTPSATISNITIKGVVGTSIDKTTVEIKIENTKFKGLDGSFNAYIKNLPSGIYTHYSRTDFTGYQIITIDFSGKPTESKSEPLMIEIPANRVSSNEALSVTMNTEAKWDIKDKGIQEYAVTTNNGTSNKTEYAKDETVIITANAPATGKQFKEWTVVSGGVTLADPTSATTTFTMPDNAVQVTATYDDVVTSATISDITIEGRVGEETERYYFTTVTITNDEFVYTSYNSPLVIGMVKNAPAGLKHVSRNNISKGDTSFEIGFTPSVPNESSSEPIEIIIPGAMLKSGNDIVATVNPNAKWNILGIERDVTVNNGTGTDKYVKGDTVTITANTPATGKQFKGWTVVSGGVTLADPTNATTTFTMPDNDVEVTATYEDEQVTSKLNIMYYDISNTPLCDTESFFIKVGDVLKIREFAGYEVERIQIVKGIGIMKNDNEFTVLSLSSDFPEIKIFYTKLPMANNPAITVGGGFDYQISTGNDMTLTCSGKLEDLTGVYVDGKLVDASNYTLKSGSTILTLKSSYLDTLSAGKHTLKFQYKDNVSVETDFTIIAKEAPKNDTVIKDTTSPKTGDNSTLTVYAFTLLLTSCLLGTVLFRRKKNFKK